MNFIELLITFYVITLSKSSHMSEEEISQTVSAQTITYGSTVRIKNILTKYHLSSWAINWSTGSHLQAVDAVKENDKHESLFTIKEADSEPLIATGEPLKCDSIIRLEHISSKKNLHSHPFPSFLGVGQEVCAFGDGDGEGDVNDNFKIICYKNEGDIVKGKTQFFLYHMGTQKYLAVDYKNSMFTEYNCRGCPINGHREVIMTDKKDKQCLWQIVGGIIFSNPNDEEKNKDNDDDKKDEF